MKKAYLQTIEDFEIELANTKWWRFKKISELKKQIDYYYTLVNAL
jgi:hypothetical protein